MVLVWLSGKRPALFPNMDPADVRDAMEESINVYGRFTKESYGTLLRQALAVDVSTARAHNLLHAAPFVSAKDVAIVRATEIVAAEDGLDDVDPGYDADDPQ